MDLVPSMYQERGIQQGTISRCTWPGGTYAVLSPSMGILRLAAYQHLPGMFL